MLNTMNSRKGDVERERVRRIGLEYDAISDMLGVKSKKKSKVLILEAALKFIHHNTPDTDTHTEVSHHNSLAIASQFIMSRSIILGGG